MADRTYPLSQDTPPRAGQQFRSVPMTNLGFVAGTSTLPNDTARHQDMARLLDDPATVLLTALAEWATAVHEPDDVEAVTYVQAMDLRHDGTVGEGLTHRTTLLLAQLLRHDADLRAARGIPSAPAWAGAAR